MITKINKENNTLEDGKMEEKIGQILEMIRK